MNIILSIITINYNNDKGLEKTILSVLAQSFSNFEYIIIDAGSSDNSVEIIKKYEHKISYWISERDAGIYNGMNKGLNKAMGRFCLFLNSGDYLQSNNCLQKIEKFFLENYDIIYGDLILDFGNRQMREKYPFPFTLYNFVCTSLPHPSSFISTSLLKKLGGYDEEFKIISDWIFFLRAFIEEKVTMKRIDEVISVHNMFGLSSQPNKFSEDRETAILKYYPLLKGDYDHFKQLQYYELSRPHQFIKRLVIKVKYLLR